ncbi:MAG: peptide ABC transporter ATP-binding protein, partial [Eubacterium sp.]
VCVMYGGQSVEIADVEAFFQNPMHPYSKMLLSALPENGLKAPGGYAPKDGSLSGCPFYDRCPNAFEKCQESPKMVGFKNHQVRCHLYEPENLTNIPSLSQS